MAAPKKVGRVDRPQPGSTARPAPAISPVEIPSWQLPTTQLLETAARDNRPLVVYFPAENDGDAAWHGKELVELSKQSATFIRIPYNGNREKSAWENQSPVPTSKLLSDNPSRDYGIPVGRATVLVTDSWGNSYFEFRKLPTDAELKSAVEKVSDRATATNRKLQRNLERAKASWEKKDAKSALSAVLSNFKEGVVGIESQQESIRLYHEVMDAARGEVSKLAESADAESARQLRAMKTTYRGTDVAKDIDEALARIKG